ncbi:transcriptional repressor, partial [uncultured Brevundimonas sp.]|uniref:transcriptional repressor n=1 Tax=uncultured Brevundimonas sp. TaxID=213418 RepID=UPI0026128389
PAKPPTVYRALEFLERKGLAHRIASISAYVACASGGRDHAAAFLICDCCGATEEVSSPVAGELGRAADAAGYAIERTTIEAHGRCPACQ